MDVFFTAKYNIFPVLLDYIKTYNVHTVDISTLPFTVSGLNRQLFFRFFISTTNNPTENKEKKRPARKKTTKCFAYGDKRMRIVRVSLSETENDK